MKVSKTIEWKGGGFSETPFGNYYIHQQNNLWIGEFKDTNHEYYKQFIHKSEQKEEVVIKCQEHFETKVIDLLNDEFKTQNLKMEITISPHQS